MIDYVHLSAFMPVDEAAFRPDRWKLESFNNGSYCVTHFYRGTTIRYYPLKDEWTIKGKIIPLLYDTQVLNVDDIYGTDLDRFVADLNGYLQSLLSHPVPIDIRDFTVSRIDYCFNVRTPYVQEYLDFLGRAFKLTNSGNRKNYVHEHNLKGSVYIKTNADYRDNTLRQYVLNYYDKHDQLCSKRSEGMPVRPADWQHAQQVLRLEVQCGFEFLQAFCKKLSVPRRFGDLLSYDIAYQAHATIYQRIFRADATQDYCTYRFAKSKLANPTARKVLELVSEHHAVTASCYRQGRKRISNAGIYPFCLLPNKSQVAVLANPLKLIQAKIKAAGALTDACALTIAPEE